MSNGEYANKYNEPPKYDVQPQQQQMPQMQHMQQMPQMQQMQQPVVSQQPMMMPMYNAGFAQSNTVINPTQVTVNVTQQINDQGPRSWSTSLCGCFEDMSSCCCVFFFGPCYTCCHISPRLGESCCAPFCLKLCGFSVSMVYRTKMRAAHGLLGGAIDDCCTVRFCAPCVLCQIKRELDYIEKSTGKPAFRLA